MTQSDESATDLAPPKLPRLKKYWPKGWKAFLAQSDRIGSALTAAFDEYLWRAQNGEKAVDVLDFGCGIGRGAFRLHARRSIPTHACDVNEDALAYLQAILPSIESAVNTFSPPLPYPDVKFDAVVSISIWTHLTPDDGLAWLREIERVLKPGGYAFISVSGPAVLEHRRQRGSPGWDAVTTTELRQKGLIFIEYPKGSHGIAGRYGLAAHHPDYIREKWSEHFEVIEIRERAIDNIQDLVVLKKIGTKSV